MKLSYDISYSIAALIISLVLVFIISYKYSSLSTTNKRFKYFVISAISLIALDIITVITNDYAQFIPRWGNIILNSMYFFNGAIVGLLFVYYIIPNALETKSTKVRKYFYIVNLSVVSAYLISLIFNGFFGFYFNFDNGTYTHGAAYLFVNAIAIALVLEGLTLVIVGRKHFKLRQRVSTILFVVIFLSSFLLQITAFPNILLSDFGTALGLLISFFSLETPDYLNLMATLDELNELKGSLEIQVQNRTKELDEEKEAYEELTLETLSSLARVIDAKDHYTVGHSFRVAAYAKGMAQRLGFSFADTEQLYFAGLVHDVGKIGISEAIIAKPGKLTEREFEIIKSHPALGGNILRGIRQFKVFEQVARNHHERYDGNGYPDKLKGEDIPYEARIVTICDTFDAMTSDRSYRKALTDEKALQELIDCSGTQFDPELVKVFIDLYKSFPDTIRNHIEELSK